MSQGASNVNVVVTGTSASGSEFFDADNARPNHIVASVSGSGVTVNSVTWNPATPQQATLNLSVTAGATLGIRNITITNPDGQQATGTAILTIGATCVADFNKDGFVTGDDLDAFSALFQLGDLRADVNNDGLTNGDDFDFFATHFNAGC